MTTNMIDKRREERIEQLKKFSSLVRTLGSSKKEGRKSNLESATMMHKFVGRLFREAYNPKTVVVWCDFGTPPEVIWACGALPFRPEMACAMWAARSQPLIRELIQKAEEHGLDSRLCSFIKAIMGATLIDLMPSPDLIVSSLSYCDGVSHLFHQISQEFNYSFLPLNIPTYPEEVKDKEYVAGQLKQLVRELCKMTGRDIKEVEVKWLPQAVKYSNQVRRDWEEVSKLRATTPHPLSGSEAMPFAPNLVPGFGHPKLTEIFSLLLQEVRERIEKRYEAVANPIVKLIFHHLPIFYGNLLETIESLGGVIVTETVNLPIGEINTADCYQGLAQNLLNRIDFGVKSTERQVKTAKKLNKQFNPDGVVILGQTDCGFLENTFPPLFRYWQQTIRTVVLPVDCLVGQIHNRLLETRLTAFMEGFRPHIQTSEESTKVSMGLDVGAAYTKVVIIKGLEIIGWAVLPTTSDGEVVESVIAIACQRAGLSSNLELPVITTGIGGKRSNIEGDYISEISCLSEGIFKLCSGVRTVLSVGGQDSKVITLDSSGQRVGFKMNQRCAAGTGRFVANMGQVLNIPLDTMRNLSLDGIAPITIDNTCTVFAESEIVKILAINSASSKEVLAGIYQAIINQLFALVIGLDGHIIQPIVLVGGLALHKGMRELISKDGRFGDQVIALKDPGIPYLPQFVEAYGAALYAQREV